MTPQQPLDYVENYDQLDELKAADISAEYVEHPDNEIVDLQETDYMALAFSN